MINHTLEMCCTYIVYIFSKKNLLVLQNFTILSVKNKNKRFEKFDPEKKYFLELIQRGLRKDGHRTHNGTNEWWWGGIKTKFSQNRVRTASVPSPGFENRCGGHTIFLEDSTNLVWDFLEEGGGRPSVRSGCGAEIELKAVPEQKLNDMNLIGESWEMRVVIKISRVLEWKTSQL